MTPEPERDAVTSTSTVRRVALHVVRCNTCQTAVDTLGGEANVTGYLEAQRATKDVAVVERVLGMAVVAGSAVLADLVFELARTLFYSDDDFAHYAEGNEPRRDASALSSEIVATSKRLGAAGVVGIADECQSVAASSSQVAEAGRTQLAWAVLKTLESLEGGSPRGSVLAAHAHIAGGDAKRGLALAKPVFDDPRLDRLMRSKAAIALVRAYFILDRHADLDAVVARARESGCARPVLSLYAVANAGAQGELAEARDRLAHVATNSGIGWSTAELRRARHLTNYIAKTLGLQVSAVEHAMGAA